MSKRAMSGAGRVFPSPGTRSRPKLMTSDHEGSQSGIVSFNSSPDAPSGCPEASSSDRSRVARESCDQRSVWRRNCSFSRETSSFRFGRANNNRTCALPRPYFWTARRRISSWYRYRRWRANGSLFRTSLAKIGAIGSRISRNVASRMLFASRASMRLGLMSPVCSHTPLCAFPAVHQPNPFVRSLSWAPRCLSNLFSKLDAQR